MIRPFSLPDLESILQIENQSFPKSAYDWTTFLNLHYLYAETFWIYITPSTSPSEVSGSGSPRSQTEGLRVDPEQRLPSRTKGHGWGAIERVNTNDGRKEGRILGYIIFSQDGHVISIAVHPHHRRKGIGRELLQTAMKASSLRKVWAEVRRSNQGAQAFYSNMGFRITGLGPNYYGNEDALIMEWTPADSPPTPPRQK